MTDKPDSIYKKPELETLQNWVYEAQWAAREWREASWRCQELYDGGQASWTQEDWDTAKDSGITPLTINRTFPTVNLILGYYTLNQFDMIAKGRTQKDSETSQVMTEGMAFVMDQYDGGFLIQQAFGNQIVPGFGCMSAGLNNDPRHEYVMVEQNDWKEVWWDPFSSPWWEPKRTRYVFKQRWMDIENLKRLFEKKAKDIEEQYSEFLGNGQRNRAYADFEDEGAWVEQRIKMLAGTEWCDKQRRRVRPVEMWYPLPERCLFALFPDGRYIELTDQMPIMAKYEVIQAANEVVAATVLKMQVRSFFGDIELQDMPSPFPHDQYPLVPFVGYIDRYGFPYGVPQQIAGMQEEVNKRRSMAMSLLKSRRVMAEEDAASDKSEAGLQRLYEEANKLDGFMVLSKGGLQKFKIAENAELSPAQMKLMESSQNEISEIAGPNYEMMGYESNATSGIAIEKRSQPGRVRIAPLLENLRRSMKRLGEQLIANMQGFWTGEKVLRITDRMSGAEKFVEINKSVRLQGGAYEVKNNISQGKYDCIISEAPQTDTTKEKNIELLTTWAQKSPPEWIPMLMSTAFQLLDLPNKEELIQNIKQMMGENPLEEDLSPEEVKQRLVQKLQAQQKQAQMQAAMQQKAAELELQNKDLENKKLMAEIAQILDEQKLKKAEMVMQLRQNVLQLPQRGGANGGNGSKQVQRTGNRPENRAGSSGAQTTPERKKPASVSNAVAGQS